MEPADAANGNGPADASRTSVESWSLFICITLLAVCGLDMMVLSSSLGPFHDGRWAFVHSVLEWSGCLGAVSLLCSIGLAFARRVHPTLRIANLLLSVLAGAAGLLAPLY